MTKIKTSQLLTLITLFLIGLSGFSQKNVPFEKEFFPDKKSELKDAKHEYEIGDDFYIEHTRGGYKLALNHYIIAQDFNENNDLLNYKIGKCFLFGSVYKVKALQFFEKAYSLNHEVDKEIHYMLGQAHHIRSEWNKAINEYKKHQQTLTADAPLPYKEMIAKQIEECKTGIALEKYPVRVFIDNMGDVINSKYAEYGAIISADESVMMFTSRRDNSTGGKIDPSINEYFEDIYISYNKDGKWTSPINMGKPINTDGHDATVNISPDGTVLLVYLDDNGDGNMYQCTLKGDVWSKPKKLGKNINTSYHETSACYSADGKTLFYVSEKPEESLGGHDIFVSKWDEDKDRWGESKNIGGNINSKYDEESVFVHPDGQTMYFSSKGHNTMGGYDIFKSELKNGIWGKAENLGYPVNTPDDDVFFVMDASGKRGYYSSFNPGGFGEKDIYVINFLGPEKNVVLNTEDNLIASIAEPIKEEVIEPMVEIARKRVTLLKGLVRNAISLEPIAAKIELIDNEKSEVVANFTSNSTTGKYLVTLPSGRNYGLAVKAEGYLFHSENFIIPAEAAFSEIEKNIDLEQIKVGSKIILKNIFFDFDKSTLRPESGRELANLTAILTENPTIRVEISGHTDNKGSDEYNQKLSQSRAKTVVDHLVAKGIKTDRLTFAGYGESQPIATNDTDEGRQLNRRTEFKITGL